MKKEIRTVEKEVYIAFDGTEFESQFECIEHEEYISMYEKEKKAEHLKVDLDAISPPYVYDRSAQPEYLWFKVESKEDLAILLEAYSSYFGKRRRETLTVEFFEENMLVFENKYPDHILIEDYSKGPHETEISTFSLMYKKMAEFASFHIEKGRFGE